MRRIGISMIGALLAGALGGCCSCGGFVPSPVPYSVGNPYECPSCCFWGVGSYMQQYGFLRRPCNDCNDCRAEWSNIMPATAPATAPAPATTPPAAPPAYDTYLPAPQVPPAPAPEETNSATAPAAPAP